MKLRFTPGPIVNLMLIGTLPLVGCCVMLFMQLGVAVYADEVVRPNIVFIVADDLGYGDLSCFGQQRFETPNLDRLAKRGVRMTQHYAGSTVCAPSRCALMTGLHTGHCEVRGNTEHGSEGQEPMSADQPTVAGLLRDAGYATGGFGKWGLGYPGSIGSPQSQGFDTFFGYNCQRHAHRYYTDFLRDDGRRLPIPKDAYTHDLIFERALEFVRDHHDQPFFCFLPVTIPHAAIEAPEEAVKPWRERFPEFEGKVGSYAGAKTTNPIATFAAMVTWLDGDVGRLVQLLDELGVDDKTLIVFTSDNGPHVEGGHDPEFFDSNGPFRGFKRDLYEGGIREPTIVCWPGHVAAGGDCDVISASWDWLPTLCAAAGVSAPEDIDGLSLLPALTGEAGQVQHDHLYWEFHERGGKQAVRRGDWKAVRLNVGKRPRGTPELYNLAADPGETTNLAAERPGIVAELAAIMDESRTPSADYNFGR